MSVEFRQRTPGEYAQILWKRKWLIMLPAIAVAAAIAIVVWRLPNVYESTTLLIVRPPTIDPNVAPAMSEGDLTMRINNINRIAQSRSSLEPLILKYDLYRRERANGMPMELVVEKMQRDIQVEIEHSRNDNIPAFRITYRERDPKKTQAVTGELASTYVNAQARDMTAVGTQTREFFEQQLADAKAQLDEIDRRRLEYMSQNINNLPTQGPALVAQYTGLREQQKALMSEIGRLNDRRSALSAQLGTLKQVAQQSEDDLAKQVGDPKATPAWGALASRKAALEAEIQNLLTQYKPAHPDVVAKKAELEAVKREMKDMEDSSAAKIAQLKKERGERPNLSVKEAEINIQLAEGELNRLQKQLEITNGQIADIEGRINAVPGAEVGLQAITREYETKKVAYDDLLKRQAQAAIGSAIQVNQQGESIQVIDPANLPQTHVAPKRMMLILMGLALGLGVGLFFAAACEVPRLLTIQTIDDAAHYTNLPVLVSLPELKTPQEATRVPRRRLMLLAAGIVITIISIPALALVLKMSGIFERFAS
ncbi:MAG TPA: GNVR domain-containing protein [Pyrinomonadaceae bacterium]|jgi:polysaccharide chain length determinant protein (PEP-CTERM system associated)